jgi:hypothetical protein
MVTIWILIFFWLAPSPDLRQYTHSPLIMDAMETKEGCLVELKKLEEAGEGFGGCVEGYRQIETMNVVNGTSRMIKVNGKWKEAK